MLAAEIMPIILLQGSTVNQKETVTSDTSLLALNSFLFFIVYSINMCLYS